MSHKIAKLILEHAFTFLEREEAVRTALSLGMPLQEIEEYLDWLERAEPASSGGRGESSEGGDESPPRSEEAPAERRGEDPRKD